MEVHSGTVPHRGRQGASRQGWSKVNVRALIYDLRQEYPRANHDRLVRLAVERAQESEDVLLSAFDILVSQAEESWRSNRQRAESRETNRQQRQQVHSKDEVVVEKIVAEINYLNELQPNGKRARFCTGTYMAKLGGGWVRAGKKAGNKLIGEVFDAKSLREIIEK